jgi:class 3 adenylate cyclase
VEACPSCGRDNAEEALFCQFCGTALVAAAPAADQRKVVTVVFTDVTGSTALGEKLDPESMRHVISRYFDAMRDVIERHGGTVEKFIGDAVMAVFGIPQLHEDDALRAVRAAVEMRDALAALNLDLQRERGVAISTRTGVNTGEVVAGGDATANERLVTGEAVNVAARFEQAAEPGEILIGEATYALVRDAVEVEAVEPLELKGKSELVAAFRLLSVRAGAAGRERQLDSPMVGRERPLRMLEDSFGAVASDRSCHLFTALGSPGVGKSRLVLEFVGRLNGRATVLRGRCLSYGDGITFWPVVEIVQAAAGLSAEAEHTEVGRRIRSLLSDADDAAMITDRIEQVLGLSEVNPSLDETFWAIRKLLEHLARDKPVVVVIDDIHWAEPTLLDLIEHVADWTRDAPVFLICLARPELLEIRPNWGGGKLNASSLLLEPLSAAECEQLIVNALGTAGLPTDARERILRGADGNPLFVEEMLGMLIDDGLLRREADGWVVQGDLTDVTVPASIQALLAARLDRLAADERSAIERGSVEGSVFHVGGVEALSLEPHRSTVRPNLLSLVRKELIRADRSELAGEDAFRFHHLLLRDAECLAKADSLLQVIGDERVGLHRARRQTVCEPVRELLVQVRAYLLRHRRIGGIAK